jgi:hypothetical protein
MAAMHAVERVSDDLFKQHLFNVVCPGTGGQVVKSYCSHFAAQIPSD